MTPVEAYGGWTASAPRSWPERAVENARRTFVDTIACIVAGADEAVTRRVLATVGPWSRGTATVVGHDRRLAPPAAALVNATAAHALDYDDNFDPAKAHASAVLVPAVLAVAEDRDLSLAASIDAYTVGLQILGRVGQGMNPYHRIRGWHATSTLGVLAAAAAVARLLALDREQAGHAISIATSRAGGFMSQFGTMTKPVHAGFAAEGGVVAAHLAAAGITAGRETLDGRTGMNRLMVGPDLDALRASLGGPAEHGQTLEFATENVGEPLFAENPGLKPKRFPSCGSVHRALDALLELRERHGFAAADVRSIKVEMPAQHYANLMYPDPESGTEAKFSLEYGLAVGLETGTNRLADFTDEAARRPHLRPLMNKVEVHTVEKLESAFPTRVAVTLQDGTVHRAEVDFPVGSYKKPLSAADLWAKFDDCVDGRVGDERRAQIKAILNDMSASARDLMALLA